MDVGTTLRTARERRDLPIAELAARTKIPVGVLQALEDNAFEKVPRGIFVRGFIRAYAREVGLTPEEIVQQFLIQTGDATPATPELAPPVEEMVDDVRIDPDVPGSRPGWGYALMVAALLVAFVTFTRPTSPTAPDVAAAPEVDSVFAEAGLQPASALVEELQPVATAGTGLVFDLQVHGPCWIEAMVDGRKLVYRLMQAGERETIQVDRELVLRVGDPSALTYTVNGREGEPLGKPGVPVTVRFTSEGERPELAS